MKKDKINFIISLSISILTLIISVVIYSLTINNWFLDLVKDIMVGAFSGTIVSCVILYSILKNSIDFNNRQYCYALNDLLEVYEYLLKIEELPFGMDNNKCIEIVKSVDDIVNKLEYETIFKKNIEPYELITTKTIYLSIALKSENYDSNKLQKHYFEILKTINHLSKKPKCFEMEIINNNCQKKLIKMNNYIK